MAESKGRDTVWEQFVTREEEEKNHFPSLLVNLKQPSTLCSPSASSSSNEYLPSTYCVPLGHKKRETTWFLLYKGQALHLTRSVYPGYM